ncbi:MAG: manganese efflux pump MntP family protein [Candidatus Aminicenantales bacterium]
MNIFLVLALALALAMDAFAVSMGLSLSLKGMTGGQTFRLAFHFGLFQFLMPVLGWAAGENIQKYIQDFDHWVAFGLLLLISGKMIHESFRRGKESKALQNDPTRGTSVFVLSLATSIDSLAVGLSLAVLDVNIIYPAAVIGLVAFIMTVLGAKIGPLLGRLVGERAGLLGGIVLLLVGIKILVDHLP